MPCGTFRGGVTLSARDTVQFSFVVGFFQEELHLGKLQLLHRDEPGEVVSGACRVATSALEIAYDIVLRDNARVGHFGAPTSLRHQVQGGILVHSLSMASSRKAGSASRRAMRKIHAIARCEVVTVSSDGLDRAISPSAFAWGLQG